MFKIVPFNFFEPRLAESESAVLPLDDPPNNSWGFKLAAHSIARCEAERLTLGELSSATCFAEAHFLTFNFSRVTSHKAAITQWLAQSFIVFNQCTG